jgi:hypothetical protein
VKDRIEPDQIIFNHVVEYGAQANDCQPNG